MKIAKMLFRSYATLTAAALAITLASGANAAEYTQTQLNLLAFMNGKHFACTVDNNGVASMFEFGTWVEKDLSITGEQSENISIGSVWYYYENNVRGFVYNDESGFGIYLNSFQARRIDSLPSPYSWRAPIGIRLNLEGIGTGVKVSGSVTYEGSLALPFESCGAYPG